MGFELPGLSRPSAHFSRKTRENIRCQPVMTALRLQGVIRALVRTHRVVLVIDTTSGCPVWVIPIIHTRNPHALTAARPLVRRNRHHCSQLLTRQNFETRSWSAAVTPAIAAREASAMSPSRTIFIKIYAWGARQALRTLPSRLQRGAGNRHASRRHAAWSCRAAFSP